METIAQKVIDEVDAVGYKPEFAEKVCHKYYGFNVYKYEPNGKLPSANIVWKIFSFTDGSLVYLDVLGITVYEKENRPLDFENPKRGPIYVTN